MRRHFVVVTLSCCFSAAFAPGCGQQESGSTNTASVSGKVLAIADLTWQDIDALNRERTLFLLAVGMLEEHGPHLPIAADTIGVEYEAGKVAERLSQALPDWNIVMMPAVNYGSSGVNQVGNVAVHPGTYAVRKATLRSLVADIGAQIAQNRFKWIFVMNGHGAPTHHAAVNDASDFVSEVFNATMLNVSGLFTADPAIQAKGEQIAARHFSPADVSSFGQDAHAGVGETSGLLAIRPDLVRSSYRSLAGYRAENRTEMRDIASRPDWPGYFSSPARATADYGRDVEAWWVDGMTDLILQAVRGENLLNRPRWPEPMLSDPEFSQLVEDILQPEREFELKLERWLEQRKSK
jgi:creatinine amidohydrolase/Fe(II)-dependent formamide hydrolase-like protein